MPHQSQLSPDVAHGDDPREEDTGQPGANVQEVRGRVPTHRTTVNLPATPGATPVPSNAFHYLKITKK